MLNNLFFAGDIEEGDTITSAPALSLVSTGTGMSEPAKLPAKGLKVVLVRENHPSDPSKVLFKGHDGLFYELPRAARMRTTL